MLELELICFICTKYNGAFFSKSRQNSDNKRKLEDNTKYIHRKKKDTYKCMIMSHKLIYHNCGIIV